MNTVPIRSTFAFLFTQAVSVDAGSITSFADLSRIPFTDKTALRNNYSFGMFAVPMSEVVRIHASSGTTTRPLAQGDFFVKEVEQKANREVYEMLGLHSSVLVVPPRKLERSLGKAVRVMDKRTVKA